MSPRTPIVSKVNSCAAAIFTHAKYGLLSTSTDFYITLRSCLPPSCTLVCAPLPRTLWNFLTPLSARPLHWYLPFTLSLLAVLRAMDAYAGIVPRICLCGVVLPHNDATNAVPMVARLKPHYIRHATHGPLQKLWVSSFSRRPSLRALSHVAPFIVCYY